MSAAVAFGVRVLRERKDGEVVEGWLASPAYGGFAFSMCHANLFQSEDLALTTTARRRARNARVVPIVAVEALP